MFEMGKMRTKGRKHVGENGEQFFKMDDLFKDGLTFAACTEITASQQLFDRSLRNSSLDVRYSIGSIGKTSYSFLTNVYPAGTDTPIVCNRIKFIFIDRDTRRPKPLPQYFLDEYKGKGEEENKSFIIPQIDRPDKTFVHNVQVMWLDTDINNHTNFSAYVVYAINAIHYAFLLKKSENSTAAKDNSLWSGDLSCLDGFSEETVLNGLKDAKICYIKECREGDEVCVHLWKSVEDDYKIFVSLETPSSNRLCQITLEYFDSRSK